MKTIKQSMMLSRVIGLGAVALLGAAGCNSGTESTEAAGNSAAAGTAGVVDRAVNSAGQAVDSAADAAATAAPNAENVASNVAAGASSAASQAGNAMAGAAKNLDDAATVTPKVKAALVNNAALKNTKIDVDTTDKGVTLTGNVKSQAQKSLAAAIAKKNAPGYAIANNLKVAK